MCFHIKQKPSSEVEGAMAFVRKVWNAFEEQKKRWWGPETSAKWRKEWQQAVKDLMGADQVHSVDDALSSVQTPSMSTKKTATKGEEEEEEAPYTGTSALVAVKPDDSA